MKARLRNGETLDVGYASIGYRASEITLTGRDTRYMLNMLRRDPHGFEIWLAQLDARFITFADEAPDDEAVRKK